MSEFVIDERAARFAVECTIRDADHEAIPPHVWIAAQLRLMRAGIQHDQDAVAIYREHAADG